MFKFPIPPDYNETPVWTGSNFQIGSEELVIIKYARCDIGWDSDLTMFHEMEADAGNHYIDRASRLHARFELSKIMHDKSAVILEIGSSSGYLLEEIKSSFPKAFLIGSDCIPEPLEKIARTIHDIPLIQFDLSHCPLPDNSVDVVIALNVLEHIQDDEAALGHIFRILKPGGHAIIEVPANSQLYDFYDEQLKHFRRYNIRDLRQICQRCGFFLSKKTHLGVFLYPLFKWVKTRNRKNGQILSLPQKQIAVKSQIQSGGPVVNNILFYLMLIELYAGKIISYPCGIRCSLTLQKPQN